MNNQLYDAHFQNIFLAFILRDNSFLDSVGKDLDPGIFGNEYAQRVCRLIIDFWKKEKSAPGELLFHIIDDLKEQNLLAESLYDSVNIYIDDLFAIPLQNKNYVLNEFNRFIRHQAFSRNIIPLTELVQAGKFDDAEELVKQLFLHRPSSEQDLGALFDLDPTDRVTRRRQRDVERFWWLIPDIDQRMQGLARGELMILQSQRSSAGKSAALAFLARQYAFQQRKVLIYTLEMSQASYEDRLDMCIAGITRELLQDHTRIALKLQKLMRLGGQIWIKQFPSYLTSVSDLRRHKEILEKVHNFYADVVLIDYLDELGPEKRTGAGNSFEVGKEISSHLRGWGVKDNVGMVSAIQSQRGAEEADVADMKHAGESIAKVWIADIILSINRTKTEAEQGITRLYWVKNREGRAGFSIQVNTDFETMQFIKRNHDD